MKRFFRRGPWELAASIVIGAGVLMLLQPFALVLYTWSFITMLAGTVMFMVVSKFPEYAPWLKYAYTTCTRPLPTSPR